MVPPEVCFERNDGPNRLIITRDDFIPEIIAADENDNIGFLQVADSEIVLDLDVVFLW